MKVRKVKKQKKQVLKSELKVKKNKKVDVLIKYQRGKQSQTQNKSCCQLGTESQTSPIEPDVLQKKIADKKNSKYKNYSDSQISGAMTDLQNGISCRKTALKWSIPRTTLESWKLGRTKPDSRPGPNTYLTANEENLLVDWLIEMGKRGFPLSKKTLLDSVQNIVIEDKRNHPFKDGRPGDSWFRCFLERHPEISKNNAESISRSRGALTEGCIRG